MKRVINIFSIAEMITLLSVVDEYDIDGSRKGLYEIAKIKQGNVLNSPIRFLTVDEILEIVNKENEYGNVETKR